MERKEQLMEDVKRRLQEICAYNPKVGLNEITVLGGTVSEADDDNQSADNAQEEPAPQGAPEQPDMQGAPQDMPQDMPQGMPQGDEQMPTMDPNIGMGEGPQTPEGLNPQGGEDLSGEDFDNAETMQPDDEVLDVTELTDAQEDIEKEIHTIGGKFEKVLNAIKSFEDKISANDEKIESLKAEIEKRNPTQIEKLNMQTAHSYPFNIKPEDYWKDKTETSNYSTESDNNGKDQAQYTITKADVEGDNNWKGISDSLDDEFIMHQSLDKLLNLN